MVTDITEVVQEKKIIILSPHYDDVVLTFGGYLDALVSKGLIHTKDIRVIHVFSRSNYQVRDDAGNSDRSLRRIQHATGIRLMEDLNCLDDLIGHGNYTYELLAEKECMLRQKSWKEGEAFEFPHGTREDFERGDWEIYERIKGHALSWLSRENTAILLPLGIKEHIDHILLREAVMDARNETGQPVIAAIYLGEDQPYAGHATLDDWKQAMACVKALQALGTDYLIDADRKADLIMKHYPSQVEESYREGVLNRAGQLQQENGSGSGVERMYRLSI
jgi:hypothetical protein